MIENNPSNVSAAFEILLEEVEAEIDFINRVGARGFEGRDYEKAKEALEHSAFLTALRDKIATQRREWDDISAAVEREEDGQASAERRNLGRLRRGLRTPEVKYYEPILKALEQMGGNGKISDVLDRVGKIMKPILKEVDYDPLASDPDSPRWRNTAAWARNIMVQEGLLKANSARGVWEISENGRAKLKKSTPG